MTTAGAERLRAELHRLKTIERPTIVRAIGEARLHGDISENAEYDAAKDRQGFLEARIRDIESKLAHAHVVNPVEIDAGGRIVFGATVDLVDLASGEEVGYQIVGDDEADIKAGKISVSAPIARALIGKHAGDTAEVEAPSGVGAPVIVAPPACAWRIRPSSSVAGRCARPPRPAAPAATRPGASRCAGPARLRAPHRCARAPPRARRGRR
jgi:transcription elongation factor GreA